MKKFLLMLLLVSLAVSACGAEPEPGAPQDSSSLIGAWRLTAHGPADAPVPAVEGVEAGLTFNEDGTVSGTSGCNGLGGDYSAEGNQITFGEFVSTLMACDDPIMRQEESAHKVMTGTATYTVEGDTLTITNNDTVLVFTRGTLSTEEPSEPVSLTGAWTLTSYGPTDTPTLAVEGANAELTFNADGTVSGSSGCNSLNGDYSVEGDQVTFGAIVSTRMACDGAIMAQEAAVLNVLTGTASYKVEGDLLTITKDSNVLVLTRGVESTGEPEGSDLLGAWNLTSYGTTEAQSPALADVEAGLTFNEDGTLTGTSGCNQFSGTYKVDGNEIAFNEIASTLMLCDTPLMEQEEAMSQMLSELTAYRIEGNTLSIVKNGMMLVFTRDTLGTEEPSEPVSLTGTWTLTSYGTGDTLSSALADVEANLSFNEDGTVTGTSGCNEFGGDYTVEGDQITFNEIVSTLKLCDTPLMGQEEAMQQVLTETADYQIEGNTLTITNNDRVLVLTR